MDLDFDETNYTDDRLHEVRKRPLISAVLMNFYLKTIFAEPELSR